ncbi:rhodanese-like domain-containing protein [Magnetococcales bacterium HHB-1]
MLNVLFPHALSAKSYLEAVFHQESSLILDVGQDPHFGIPGSIHVEDGADIFYAESDWIQERIGCCFKPNSTIIFICDLGQKQQQAALSDFKEMNPDSGLTLRYITGGMASYSQAVKELTHSFRKGDEFHRELTNRHTDQDRFHHLTRKIMGRQPHPTRLLPQLRLRDVVS